MKICIGGTNEKSPYPITVYDIKTSKFSKEKSLSTNISISGNAQYWTEVNNVIYFIPSEQIGNTKIYYFDLQKAGADSLMEFLEINPIGSYSDACLASIYQGESEIYLAVIGGLFHTHEYSAIPTTNVQFWKFKGIWAKSAPTLNIPRYAAACVVNGDYLYAIG